MLGEIGGRLVEEIPRSRRQLRDLRTAIALQPKCRRPSGRMIAAVGFSLDNQGAPLRRNPGSEARSGDSAAHNHSVEMTHHSRGYELESRAV